MKSHFSTKQGALMSHLRLGQVASSSRQITEWPGCTLSCSDPVVLTLQLPACFAYMPGFWWVTTHELVASFSYENTLHAHSRGHIPVMCWAHASLRGIATRELPAKTSLVFNLLWVFTLSFTHTTLTKKSHIKYRVHMIKQNYNQIWHGIKANTK